MDGDRGDLAEEEDLINLMPEGVQITDLNKLDLLRI